MKTIAFFNNKGGVGKTSLVYHLAWMYADLGMSVVAADLDPQANLTSMFIDEERLESLWPDGRHAQTVYGAIQPLLDGTGDIAPPYVEDAGEHIGLLVGDLALAVSEDELTGQWPECLDRKPRAFRVISAIWRVIEQAAREREAGVVLIDVGPNLGAVNRAALIAAEHVVIPLAPDLYSLQGLRNLGPTLRRWRNEWAERRSRNPVDDLSIPSGAMIPEGYVVMQDAVRLDRSVKAHDRWMARIPAVYREAVLDEKATAASRSTRDDPACLAGLKHYRSLMPFAQEARKPMFFLTAADGALGGHAKAVQDCYGDFRDLARTIASRCGLRLP
ncbi:MAG TPA: chromosome partitioning protein [Planctomycetes bacterium]|nr:chromosome partitioning protein [Planctomycetota bacterium]